MDILMRGSVYLVHSLVVLLLLVFLFCPSFSVWFGICFVSLSLMLTSVRVNLGVGPPIDDSAIRGSGVTSRVDGRSGLMQRKKDARPPSSCSFRLKRVCSRQGARSDEVRNELVVGMMVSSAALRATSPCAYECRPHE